MSNIPPRYELPIADKQGRISREWYKYLVSLGIATGGATTSVDDLQFSSDNAQIESMALSAQNTAKQALSLFLLGGEDKPLQLDTSLLMVPDDKKQIDDTSLLAWWPL